MARLSQAWKVKHLTHGHMAVTKPNYQPEPKLAFLRRGAGEGHTFFPATFEGNRGAENEQSPLCESPPKPTCRVRPFEAPAMSHGALPESLSPAQKQKAHVLRSKHPVLRGGAPLPSPDGRHLGLPVPCRESHRLHPVAVWLGSGKKGLAPTPRGAPAPSTPHSLGSWERMKWKHQVPIPQECAHRTGSPTPLDTRTLTAASKAFSVLHPRQVPRT